MLNSYTEVNRDIIEALKKQGFTSVEFVPQGNAGTRATVELIPGRRLDFSLNVISLDSPEINHYIDGDSPMAKYIIDPDYLVDHIEH